MDDESILIQPPPSIGEKIFYDRSPEQFGHLSLPSTPLSDQALMPTIVLIHGGYWRAKYNLDYMGFACEALNRQGYITWNLEYRRVGQEGGGWPGSYYDVVEGLNFLDELSASVPIDTSRIVVLGHSAGGHLALLLARDRQEEMDHSLKAHIGVLGIIALAPICDLFEAYHRGLSNGAVREFLASDPVKSCSYFRQASPRHSLPLGLPVTLIHGSEDKDVPFDITHQFYKDACPTSEIDLIHLEHGNHFSLVNPESRDWREVSNAIKAFYVR